MKKVNVFLVMVIVFLCTMTLNAQSTSKEIVPDVSDELLLQLYNGARVADVVDGLVNCGYMDVGVMDRAIAPLWYDVKTMEHSFSGIALTVRYGPTNRPMHPGADLTKPENNDKYQEWKDKWYTELSPEPFIPLIKKGTVIVIDNKDDYDTGTTGSNNIMKWQLKGAVGLVCTGGVRDIDEVILQKNPVYTDYYKRGRGERIGRNEFIDMQQPVVVGGVLVYPGDVVVADLDGVVVVPRHVAVRVGQIAYIELAGDMAGRKRNYELAGRKLDKTVILTEEPKAFFKRLGLPEDPNK